MFLTFYTSAKLAVVCLFLAAFIPSRYDATQIHRDLSSHVKLIKRTDTPNRWGIEKRDDRDMTGGVDRAGLLSMLSKVRLHKSILEVSEKQSDTDDTNTTNDEQEELSSPDKPDVNSANGTESASSDDTDGGSETETQSPLDSMFIETRKPGLGSPLTETVFKEHSLDGLFNSCVIDPADTSKQSNATACYVDDAYNDRLTFSFTFRFPAAELEAQFENHPPALEVLGDSSSISEPTILTKSINRDDSTGKISVAYGCKTASNGMIALALTLHFGEGEDDSVSIRWKKECKNAKNDKIELGYLLLEKGNSDATRQPFPNAESPLVVAPNDVSTEVYIKLGQAGAQQQFLAPYITSSNPGVTPVTIRGNHPSGGVLEGLEQTTLQVGYECALDGESDIALSIGIPPFENLTATWKKDCGGRKTTNLQVGTSENANDVVKDGKPTSSFQVAIEHIGTAHSDEHLHLPGNQSDWSVYITNSQAESSTPAATEAALHVGRITLTIEHPNVIAARSPVISSRSFTGWREETSPEHIIESGGSLKVSFHFLCRALGESRILITVPFLQYDKLEFGIAKECTHIPTAHKAKQMVWTVGNVFGAGVAVVIILCLIWIWRRRQAKAKGFEALPVTER